MKNKRLIKVLLWITVISGCFGSLSAQIPAKFLYQAIIRNAEGQLVQNSQVGIRVSILSGDINGNVEYVETQVGQTNSNGLLTIEIGDGTVQQGSFNSIQWENGQFFLKTDLDPDGGTDYTISSTMMLLSVPYAMYAERAGNTFSGDYNDLINTPSIPAIPSQLSAFQNDMGYITMDSIPTIPAIPSQLSAFQNDVGYITMDSIPTMPTIPSQLSAFQNDMGYITMDSIPTIPAIPSQLSAFQNDMGYITMDSIPSVPSIPSQISAFQNDVGYITSYTEQQILSIHIDTIFLSGGSFVKLPPTFDGDYNSLRNKPNIPEIPTAISAFQNDAGYLTQSEYTALMNSISQLTQQLAQQQLQIDSLIEAFHNVDVVDTASPIVEDTSLVAPDTTQAGTDTIAPTPDIPTVNPFACPNAPTVSDIDGNVYNTVKIGQQCWMKENLRVTHYPDGREIFLNHRCVDMGAYQNCGSLIPCTGDTAYRYPVFSTYSAVEQHGYLYNWPAAVNGTSGSNSNPSGVQGICPNGWHIPSYAEWEQLFSYVKGRSEYVCGDSSANIAKALASQEEWGTSGIFTDDSCLIGLYKDQNNATGFSALPSGSFHSDVGGEVEYDRASAYFCCSNRYVDVYGNVTQRVIRMYTYLPYVFTEYRNLGEANTVRCVKD